MWVDPCGIFSPGFLVDYKVIRTFPPSVDRSFVPGPEGNHREGGDRNASELVTALVFLDLSHFSNLRGFISGGFESVPPQ